MIIFLRDLILENSNTADQAKAMGLDYLRFGRWGKDGHVTHISQNGKLVPYTRIPPGTDITQKTDTSTTQSPTSTPTNEPTQTETPPAEKLTSIAGETDGGSATYEEFTSQFPQYSDEQEDVAQRDAESSFQSFLDSSDTGLDDVIKQWKWGGDEGDGAWTFDSEKRKDTFDRLSKHILESGVTVEAPKLHRGIAFDSVESANRFLGQLKVGESVELPPSGWAPNPEVALSYGPDSVDEPSVSMMVELDAGDTPIKGMAATKWEEEMGMDTQHEVITPQMGYTVREVKKYTVTRNGKTQTVYKVAMTQNASTNEIVDNKQQKYAMLAYMAGNMAMAQNIRKSKGITKNK